MTHPTEDTSATVSLPARGEASFPSVDLAKDGAASARPAGETVPRPPWGLSFYLFVETFSAGKVVVDLSVGGGPGPEFLRRSGAIEVLSPARPGLPLPFPAGGADLAICPLTRADVSDDGARAALFSEIHRILRPDGMCVARVPAETLAAAAVGTSLRAALADMLLQRFAVVDIVEETPFRAVSFFVPGSDDLAVSEAMARVGGKPSHLIALCTSAGERTWHLNESLLVPTGMGGPSDAGEGELAAWRTEVDRLMVANAEVSRERDELRERRMMLQDQVERLGNTVAVLRKEVERYLRQISDDAAARELLTLERDQLRRRLATAEADIEAGARELENQKASVQALRKEVARLRAARGVGSGAGR